jgi:signal transduction histidine kinase
MKLVLKTLLVILSPILANAQLSHIDSLKIAFNEASDGSQKFRAAGYVYFYYQETNRDSAFFYAEQQLLIAKKAHHSIAEGVALDNETYQLIGLGKYAEALKCLQQAFVIAENKQNENVDEWNYFITPFHGNSRLLLLSYTHHMYALLMLNTGNLEEQIDHFKTAGKIGEEINYAPRIQLAYLNLGQSYLEANKPDSAFYYEKKAEQLALHANDKIFSNALSKTYLATAQMHLGDIYKALGNDSMSLACYYQSLKTSTESNNRFTLSRLCARLCRHFINIGNKDSALYYSLKDIDILKTLGMIAGVEINFGNGYENVYLSYKLNKRFDSAFKYQGLALVTKDSLAKVRMKNLAEFQKLTYGEQLRLQNLEKEKVIYQNKVRTYFLLTGIGVLLLLAIIFYINNRQKNKANKKIEKAYNDLKSTQLQLIQSEKMASLGELTAGIAHEIQNPLNFVNNFSELNNELIAEMREEIAKKNFDEVDQIAKDVQENEQKINHHGKRADAIVKGMLQHSRSSTSVRELTNINALADEYLRLAYHGLRAKDNSFNATIKTDFDESINDINIIPQDIGRVLLNLYNNGFYAVSEKKKQQPENYEPTISVSTKKADNKITISVKDNGDGVPQKLIDKIFQPFFTTKPTGQGTGLGLSLSYDIVKVHGGEIKVETKEGEGSEFIIQLPAV